MSSHAQIGHQEIGGSFDGIYYVESVYVKKTKQNKDYTDMMLRDKSGARNVKFWGVVDGVSKGGWVYVAANVEDYQGTPSIVAKNLEPADEPEDLSEYVPVYEDVDGFAERFDGVRTVMAEHAGKADIIFPVRLIDEVYGNATFFEKFVRSPGSSRPHYGKQGGLIASTVRIAELCIRNAEAYGLNDEERAILICAALLIRIGAVEAFGIEDCMPTETRKGLLIGVKGLTTNRVSLAVKRTISGMEGFGTERDIQVLTRIHHAVASHDGVGILPMTKEAIVLSISFRTDMEIVDAIDFIDTDENLGEEFTAWDPAARRRYYTGIRSK